LKGGKDKNGDLRPFGMGVRRRKRRRKTTSVILVKLGLVKIQIRDIINNTMKKK